MDIKAISGVIVENSNSLTLEEFAHAIKIKKEVVVEMIEYELIQPHGQKPEQWRFDSFSLKQGRIASSFYRDLEVNLQGIALALDLLSKIETLELELKILRRLADH